MGTKIEIDRQYLEYIKELMERTVADINSLPSEDYLAKESKRVPEKLTHNVRIVARLLDYELNRPSFVPFLVETKEPWQSTEPSVSGTVTVLSIHT
jgi:hypothetical protein